jgi:DNA-binding CsgD family transcriptional regulator
MDRDGEIDRVIAGLYDAAYDQGNAAWASAGDQVMRCLGGAGAVLQIADLKAGRSSVLAYPGCDGLDIPAYESYYVQHDLWAKLSGPSFIDRPVLTHEHVAPQVLERSEIYNDFLRQCGNFFWCLGASLPMADGKLGLVGVLRTRHAEAFELEQARVLGRVLPHIRRAMQLTGKLRQAQTDLTRARGALDHFAFGIIICRADGKVEHANHAAERILAAVPELRLDARGRLAASHAETHRRLLALIRSSARRDAGDPNGAGGALPVARDTGAALRIVVAPLPQGGAGESGGALLLIDDPDRAPPSPGQILRALFDLTPAEARLVQRMAAGYASAETVAAEFGISPETVRTQRKSLHRKMEVSSHADITAILARLGLLKG